MGFKIKNSDIASNFASNITPNQGDVNLRKNEFVKISLICSVLAVLIVVGTWMFNEEQDEPLKVRNHGTKQVELEHKQLPEQ